MIWLDAGQLVARYLKELGDPSWTSQGIMTALVAGDCF
jgi:hypothetical protein